MAFGSKEDLSSLVMEHVADIIWIADLDNKLVYVSPSITRVLGYTVEKAMTQSMEKVFTHQSAEIARRARGEELARERKGQRDLNRYWTLELEMYHKNGSIIPVEINSSFVRECNGQPIGILAVARDISRLKQEHRKIKRLCAQEKDLSESLKAEVKKRSQFARVLVHELKTPLTSILASAELLLESKQEAPYDRLTKSIYRSSVELNDRISELLELTRAEIGELRIKARRINPYIMLAEIIKDVEPVISRNKQHLRTQVPSVLPYVKADKYRLRQVMWNLVDNATKATPEGGDIVIKAVENDAFLIIQVQDTGRGMRREDEGRIFEPYYRTPGSSKRYEGLGLGLTLSKQIIELHGGQIWVENGVGKGSTFSLSIPLFSSH